MARKLAAPGTLALLLTLLAVLPAAAVIPLEMLGIPSPGDVVKLIDTLTKKDSSTDVKVKLGDTVSQGKLLVARTRVNVAMERSSRNWRGRVVVHMSVPTHVSYSVNLAAIRPEDVRADPARRLLIVTMPAPQVEDVTPLLSELKSEATFQRARFRRLDADASREIQNALLREDYQARAAKEARDHIREVRERARLALQELLEALLRPSFPDIHVLVE